MTGGDAALTDEITADGQAGISFIHPMGEIFLHPFAGETQSDTPSWWYEYIGQMRMKKKKNTMQREHTDKTCGWKLCIKSSKWTMG